MMMGRLLILVLSFQSTQSFLHTSLLLPAAPRTTLATAAALQAQSIETAEAVSTSVSTGFYVHIPYCRRRCRYCDFAIVPIGSDETQRATDGFLHMNARYRQALLDEIQLLDPSKRKLSSIYFGGGTPSLAPTDTIKAVLDTIRQNFEIDVDAEITMEMDPGTFDETQLRQLADIGINRISLGVQALDDKVLEQIGRVHRIKDVYDAIGIIQRVFDHPEKKPNYSIDLISGLPGVSLAAWADTLETTLTDLQPNHISIYDLQIEKDTVFGKWYDDDDNDVPSTTTAAAAGSGTAAPRLFLPSPDDCAYMYRYAAGYLRHKGYEHYEISSYALEGKRSRHNQVYWGYETEWFAIGLGSTSFLNNHRHPRPRAMSDYIDWVKQQQVLKKTDWVPSLQQLEDDDETSSSSAESPDGERMTDVIMTRLRTIDGLDLKWLGKVYGHTIVESVLRGAELALDLELATVDDDQTLRLTDPKGFLFSNTIVSSIFVELDDDNSQG